MIVEKGRGAIAGFERGIENAAALAAGAEDVEGLLHGISFSEPSQSSELILYGQSDRLREGEHTADGCKFSRDLQRHRRSVMKGESVDRAQCVPLYASR